MQFHGKVAYSYFTGPSFGKVIGERYFFHADKVSFGYTRCGIVVGIIEYFQIAIIGVLAIGCNNRNLGHGFVSGGNPAVFELFWHGIQVGIGAAEYRIKTDNISHGVGHEDFRLW